MKQPVFDSNKHRYARLQDGTVEPLYCGDGKGGLNLSEPRNFYKAEFGRWYLDFSRFHGGAICLMHMRIVEFLEKPTEVEE